MKRPSRTRVLLTLFAGVLAAGASLGQQVIPEGPRQENPQGFTIGIIEYKATSEIRYDRNDGPEHQIEIGGLIIPPEGLDVVCLTEELWVTSIFDDQRRNIYAPAARQRTTQASTIKYSPVLDEYYLDKDRKPFVMAKIEVAEAQITRPAFVVQTFNVRADAIIAKDRETIEIPAIVTDNETQTPYEMTVRLSSMKISRTNKAEAVVEVERSGGEGTPILDALYAIDDRGNKIGGGRWVKAAPIFAERGKFEIEFVIDADADVDHLELVIVTKYEQRPVDFEITGIFQE